MQDTVLQILQMPIPNYSHARAHKAKYRDYPLILAERNKEPLVDAQEYGIAGQSYYSRVNSTTGEPIPETQPAVLLRQSIVERLADINYALRFSPEVEHLLGGPVELYIEEGLRSYKVQSYLYNEVFPNLIRKQNPSWTEDMIFKRRNDLIAYPTEDVLRPAPHSTGAAFDISLRYTKPSLTFAKDAKVAFGRHSGDTSDLANPDYFEHKNKLTKAEMTARTNRRVFYWIMRGALLEDDTGFVVNPTEFWHWSHGDQMWASFMDAPKAFFGIPV